MPDESAASMRPEPTPIVITPRTRTIILLAILAAFVLMWRAAPTAVFILLGGLTLALFLSFPVNRFSRIMPRWMAVVVTFLGLIVITLVAAGFVVPVLVQQLTALIGSVPEVTTNSIGLLRTIIDELNERGILRNNSEEVIENIRSGAVSRLQLVLESILANTVGVLSNVVGIFFKLSIMVFIASYVLAGITGIQAGIVAMAPVRYRPDVRQLLVDIGQSISRYLAGLLVSAADQAILTAIALSILGVPYAVLLGVLMGVLAFLPYVGFWLALAAIIPVALSQSLTTGGFALVALIMINMFDSNFVLPRVQGQALRVSPLITTLAVIAFGEIFGPLAAILALPFVGVLRVLYDFLVDRLAVEQPMTPAAANLMRRRHRRRSRLRTDGTRTHEVITARSKRRDGSTATVAPPVTLEGESETTTVAAGEGQDAQVPAPRPKEES